MSDSFAEVLSALGNIQRTLGEHGGKFDTLNGMIVAVRSELKQHMEEEQGSIDSIVDTTKSTHTKIATLENGFPRDPKTGERLPYYHANWHENDIEKSQDSKDFRNKIITGIIGAIVIAALSGLGAVVLSGTKVEMKRVLTEQGK